MSGGDDSCSWAADGWSCGSEVSKIEDCGRVGRAGRVKEVCGASDDAGTKTSSSGDSSGALKLP